LKANHNYAQISITQFTLVLRLSNLSRSYWRGNILSRFAGSMFINFSWKSKSQLKKETLEKHAAWF